MSAYTPPRGAFVLELHTFDGRHRWRDADNHTPEWHADIAYLDQADAEADARRAGLQRLDAPGVVYVPACSCHGREHTRPCRYKGKRR